MVPKISGVNYERRDSEAGRKVLAAVLHHEQPLCSQKPLFWTSSMSYLIVEDGRGFVKCKSEKIGFTKVKGCFNKKLSGRTERL